MLTPTVAHSILDADSSGQTVPSPEALPDPPEDLRILQRRTVDVLAGYVSMADKAEPSFRPVVERFRALHDRHNAALTAMLIRMGQEPDTDGTFMGAVNRAVVSLRALFDDIDEDVMDAIRDGENHVLTAFDDAIASDGLTIPDRQDLRAMRDELTMLLQDTRHLD